MKNGKIGKKTMKRKKTGKRSTDNAHFWGGGVGYMAKKKGKRGKKAKKE
jgi:hypothetical protein